MAASTAAIAAMTRPCAPSARRRLTTVRRGKHLLPDFADHEWVLTDNQVGKAFPEDVGAASSAFAVARYTGVGVDGDNQARGFWLVASDRGVGHPAALFERLFKNKHFDFGDL